MLCNLTIRINICRWGWCGLTVCVTVKFFAIRACTAHIKSSKLWLIIFFLPWSGPVGLSPFDGLSVYCLLFCLPKIKQIKVLNVGHFYTLFFSFSTGPLQGRKKIISQSSLLFIWAVHALMAKNLTVTQTVSPHQPHLQIMIRIVRLHNMTLCM